MSELKPCPCCGCENVIFEQYKKNGFRIVCKRCALKREQRALYQSMEWLRDRMIESWNTRAPQSEWVSVADMLPEPDECVIAHTDDTIFARYSSTDKQWYEWDSCVWMPEFSVTHWMPLPSPPKES